jgi:hypothetical protein
MLLLAEPGHIIGCARKMLIAFQHGGGEISSQEFKEPADETVLALPPVSVQILDGPEIVEPGTNRGGVRRNPVDLHRRHISLVRGGVQLRVADRALGLLDFL